MTLPEMAKSHNLKKRVEVVIASKSKHQGENASRLDKIANAITEIRWRVIALEANFQYLAYIREDVNQLKVEVENVKTELNRSRPANTDNWCYGETKEEF